MDNSGKFSSALTSQWATEPCTPFPQSTYAVWKWPIQSAISWWTLISSTGLCVPGEQRLRLFLITAMLSARSIAYGTCAQEMLVELMNKSGGTVHAWRTLWSPGVTGSEMNPGSDVTSCVEGSAWCWALSKPSEKGSSALIIVVWCLMPSVTYCFRVFVILPPWGLVMGLHVGWLSSLILKGLVPLNGQSCRIREGQTSRVPGQWIPLLCTAPPCRRRSSACSLSWRRTAHQCSQGPLRWHSCQASLASVSPQWPGICGNTGVQEEKAKWDSLPKGKKARHLVHSWFHRKHVGPGF